MIKGNVVVYAVWDSTTTVILPNEEDRTGYELGYTGSLSGEYDRQFTLTVTPKAGYEVIEVTALGNTITPSGNDYKFNVTDNTPVHIKVKDTATGKQTESSDTTLNYDNGSKTDVRTVVEKDISGTSTITVKSENKMGTEIRYTSTTVANVTSSSATVTIRTTDDESAEAS